MKMPLISYQFKSKRSWSMKRPALPQINQCNRPLIMETMAERLSVFLSFCLFFLSFLSDFSF